MSSTAIKTNFNPKRKVVLKLKRNTVKQRLPIFINTLIPHFEFTDAENRIVRPNTLLKI